MMVDPKDIIFELKSPLGKVERFDVLEYKVCKQYDLNLNRRVELKKEINKIKKGGLSEIEKNEEILKLKQERKILKK